MLRVVLYPCQGWGQGVLLYDLRHQILGHVGHGGIVIVWQLRADHHRGLPILLVDPNPAPASVRPVAPVAVDVVVGLLHGYSPSPIPSWSSQAVFSMASLVAP